MSLRHDDVAFVTKEIEVRVVDDTTWALLKDVVYKDRDTEYRVPVGYKTDFASVPRATSWLYPRTGAYSAAAIIHDWLITDMLPTGYIESNEVDRVFRQAMKELGVPFARRWVMWAGVRLGAIGNSKRRSGSLRTLPLVLLVLLASSPVVLPASLLVQLTTSLLWAASIFVPDKNKLDSQKT
jgi:hypothetical protein